DGRLENVLRAELVRRADVGVAHDVRPQVGIRVASLEIGGREEPLETLDVAARPARALVLVVARDPLRVRRDADLVAGAVVPDGGAPALAGERVHDPVGAVVDAEAVELGTNVRL